MAELQNFEMQNVINKLAVRFNDSNSEPFDNIAVDEIKNEKRFSWAGSGE